MNCIPTANKLFCSRCGCVIDAGPCVGVFSPYLRNIDATNREVIEGFAAMVLRAEQQQCAVVISASRARMLLDIIQD